MKLKLNYLWPGKSEPIQTEIHPDTPFFNTWLQSMMDSIEEDVIYFFTTETTDIFED